jgi:esterase/lipase superfamily enzyme
MKRLFALFIFVATACSPRIEIMHVPPGIAPEAPLTIFLGTTRGLDASDDADPGSARSEVLRFARFDVSVPPDREPGDVHLPGAGSAPDPATDFLVAQETYFTASEFRANMRRALASNGHEAVVFVHGYNASLAKGLYRFAQLGHDLHIPGVLVHYSWPSRGNALNYAYDRDSALFARDGFESLLREVSAAGAQRIVIVAHSMGAALTMEALRQIAIADTGLLRGKIAGVVLISPDLDVDLFRAQARRIAPLPQPFVVVTSEHDRALALAARISGQGERLGNLHDINRVADLQVTLLEVGAYSEGIGHFTGFNSQALLALLGQMGDLSAALAGDLPGRAGVLDGFVLTVRSATRIVLAPAE